MKRLEASFDQTWRPSEIELVEKGKILIRKNMMKLLVKLFIVAAIALLVTTIQASAVELTDAQVDNLVRRSYQYVAMYNVNNKFAAQAGRVEHLCC
jgi:hypothetical protein